jgi:hypothetical protein
LAEPQVGIGDHPYFLAIEPRESPGKPLLIDLESPGWVTTYAEYMRAPGTWYLMPKDGNSRLPRLSVLVSEGEQPYYAAKHVGVAGSGGSNAWTAWWTAYGFCPTALFAAVMMSKHSALPQ